MSVFAKLLSGKGGVIGKITNIIDKSVTDKDSKNEIVFQISLLLMQSKIAPYVRAALGLVVVVACLFFGDKITISPDAQQYCLYSVLGYYFLDRVFSGLVKK